MNDDVAIIRVVGYRVFDFNCHDPFVTMPCCLRVRAWHPLYLLRGLHLTSSLLLSLVFYINIRVGSVIRLFLSRRRDSIDLGNSDRDPECDDPASHPP